MAGAGSGSITGILLGALNVVVIASALAISTHEPFVGALVFFFGLLPGAGAGLFIGVIGDAVACAPRATRLAILSVPAVAVLAALAGVFDAFEYVPLASIPTLVAVLLLEGATRRRPPLVTPSSIPVARVVQ